MAQPDIAAYQGEKLYDKPMSIWDFGHRLPVVAEEHRITLGEGRTPLLRSRQIGPAIGMPNLYFKLEISNPSGSYKDRFAASAVSQMRQAGDQTIVATSSGNTGSALAAYAAATQMTCAIAIVETAPEGKLKQMLAYGARLYRVEGFGIDAEVSAAVFNHLVELGEKPGTQVQISCFKHCPEGMAGVKTIGYELARQSRTLDKPLEHVFCPAGGGGLTLATALGLIEAAECGDIDRPPAIECVQPAGNNTIAGPLREGRDTGREVTCTSTISGLQVPGVLDAYEVIAACRQTGGTGHLIEDDAVYRAQKRLAREEGIFCEPAGAVALAGLLKAVEGGEINRQASCACLVTGSGFKDPPGIDRMIADADCPTVSFEKLQMS